MRTQTSMGQNVLEVDSELHHRIAELAKARGIRAVDVVRTAIDRLIASPPWGPNWMETAEAYGLIGCPGR